MDEPIDDPVPPLKALGMILDGDRRKADGRKPPMAMCPRCRTEPLVCTLERSGAEFTCVVCGGWFGWLAPVPAEQTAELDARLEAHQATYTAQREARR